jgi:hypothetical protein
LKQTPTKSEPSLRCSLRRIGKKFIN